MLSFQEREAIIKRINEEINLPKEFKQTRSYQIINVYFLWKIQTDKRIKTPDDMEIIGFNRDSVQFATYMLDDIVFYLKEELSVWDKLVSLKDIYSDEQLTDCILYSNFFEEEFYETIPESISEICIKLLNIKKSDRILNLSSGIGDFAFKLKEHYKDVKLSCFDSNDTLLVKAAIDADVKGFRDICIIGEPEDIDSKDIAFINGYMDVPKYNYTYDYKDYLKNEWSDFPIDNSESWNACGVAINQLKDNGRAICLMNIGQLTNKQTEKVRGFLCENGYIEGVIKLPAKMYLNTWVNSYIIVLSKNNKSIKFIDASEKYITGRIKGKRNNVFSEDIIEDLFNSYNTSKGTLFIKIKENEFNLNPSRYLTNSIKDVKTVEFGEYINEIRRGISVSAAEMDQLISERPEGVKCIIPSSINNGFIDSNLYFHGDINKSGKNLTGYNDILISKTGNPFRVAISNDINLVVGNVYIIRLKGDIDPYYIKCFLSSEKGQNEIKKYSSGSATPVISVANLSKIRIPLNEDTKQKDLEIKCREIVRESEEAYKQIKNNIEELNSIFI